MPLKIIFGRYRSARPVSGPIAGRAVERYRRNIVAGFREYTRLSEQPGVDAEAIMQGTQRAMRWLMRKAANPFALSCHGGLHQPVHRLVWHGLGIMNSSGRWLI